MSMQKGKSNLEKTSGKTRQRSSSRNTSSKAKREKFAMADVKRLIKATIPAKTTDDMKEELQGFLKTYLELASDELNRFARHGNRKIVNDDDMDLFTRGRIPLSETDKKDIPKWKFTLSKEMTKNILKKRNVSMTGAALKTMTFYLEKISKALIRASFSNAERDNRKRIEKDDFKNALHRYEEVLSF